jgi:hypothetical protein
LIRLFEGGTLAVAKLRDQRPKYSNRRVSPSYFLSWFNLDGAGQSPESEQSFEDELRLGFAADLSPVLSDQDSNLLDHPFRAKCLDQAPLRFTKLFSDLAARLIRLRIACSVPKCNIQFL